MLDIFECINLRNMVGLESRRDQLIDYYIHDDECQDAAIVVCESELAYVSSLLKKEFLSVYCIDGIFGLGAIYAITDISMVLLTFKRCSGRFGKRVKISSWVGPAFERKKNEAAKESGLFAPDNPMGVPEAYHPGYLMYLESIERWVNEGVDPRDGENSEFIEISGSDVNEDHAYPRYYSKKARLLRNVLSKEKTSRLSDIASIELPRPVFDSGRVCKRITAMDFCYPLNMEKMREGAPTTVALQRGDILFPLMGSADPYVVCEDVQEEVYVMTHIAVIRTKGILPEYLQQYLSSETGKLIREMISPTRAPMRTSIRSLRDFPVILPKKSNEYYLKLFSLSKYGINDIGMFRRSKQDYVLDKQSEDGETAEDILDRELIQNMRTYKQEIMREFLLGDMEELNCCFRNGAYKATLILAGSILEAVLIDWLSEMDGVDYLEEVFIDERGCEVNTLAKYISRIKYLERPHWMQEADKAFSIKDRRNLVHAKLCMKSDEINEDTCREVIGYLEDVIRSRMEH